MPRNLKLTARTIRVPLPSRGGEMTIQRPAADQRCYRGVVDIAAGPHVVEVLDKWVRIYQGTSILAPPPAVSVAVTEKLSGDDGLREAVNRVLDTADALFLYRQES